MPYLPTGLLDKICIVHPVSNSLVDIDLNASGIVLVHDNTGGFRFQKLGDVVLGSAANKDLRFGAFV